MEKKIHELNDLKEKDDTKVLHITSIESEYEKEGHYKWTLDQMKEIQTREKFYHEIQDADNKKASEFRQEYDNFEEKYFKQHTELQNGLKEQKTGVP